MDLNAYLDVFRRRWLLIVAAAGASLLVTALTLPSTPEVVDRSVDYTATATIVANPAARESLDIQTVGLYATVGTVPTLAAKRLGYSDEPQVLASTISATTDPNIGTLTLSSSDWDPGAVARRVNVFAEELIAYFQQQAERETQTQLESVDERLAAYSARIRKLDKIVASRPGATARIAERDGLRAVYQSAVAEAAALESQLGMPPSMEILQRAVPIPNTGPSFSTPTNTLDRLLIGTALGLLLGLALALVIERIDSRLRSRDEAESAFGLPVLAEIPASPRSVRRSHIVLSANQPGSATAEGYRNLRSAVLLLRPRKATPQPSPEPLIASSTRVVMVTSPRGGEGKSSTVANLAVVMAESGRKVLVLSLDFRNPSVHRYFGVPDAAGLSDILTSGRTADLANILRPTDFAGIDLATSGQELQHPGALLAGIGPVITQARHLADIVLIDTAPLLAVSDAVDLSPHVDAALMVSRAKRTTAGQATAAQRLLSRLGVPALGVVVIGAPTTTGYPAERSRSRRLVERLGITHRRDTSMEHMQAVTGSANLNGKDTA